MKKIIVVCDAWRSYNSMTVDRVQGVWDISEKITDKEIYNIIERDIFDEGERKDAEEAVKQVQKEGGSLEHALQEQKIPHLHLHITE